MQLQYVAIVCRYMVCGYSMQIYSMWIYIYIVCGYSMWIWYYMNRVYDIYIYVHILYIQHVYTCAYIYTNMYIYIYIHIYIYMNTYRYTYVYMYTYMFRKYGVCVYIWIGDGWVGRQRHTRMAGQMLPTQFVSTFFGDYFNVVKLTKFHWFESEKFTYTLEPWVSYEGQNLNFTELCVQNLKPVKSTYESHTSGDYFSLRQICGGPTIVMENLIPTDPQRTTAWR